MDRPDEPEAGARRDPDADLPTDTDSDSNTDLTWSTRSQHRAATPGATRLVPVIAVGGVIGSLARYGLTLALPTPTGGMPWATLLANLTGALLLGLLTVLLVDTLPRNPYLRPLLGVGVLGGYTTFSAYTSETRALLDGGHAGTAFLYLLVTIGVGFLAVVTGFRLGRVVASTAGRGTR